MRAVATLVAIGGALFAHESAFAIDAVGSGLSTAALALETELRTRFPEVTEWSIAPIASSRVEEPAAPLDEVNVLHAGPRSAVRVVWRESSGRKRARTLWFDVIGERTVLVARHDLDVTRSLDQSDVELTQRDVIGNPCEALTSPVAIDGKRVTRPVRAGAVLCAKSVETKPAVARGENVTVRYEARRVALTAHAIAQRDANIGERLRVMNPSTKEYFVATVSGIREVQVHE